MPRQATHRIVALSLVTLLVVAGTALADLAVGAYRGVDVASKSVIIQTPAGLKKFRVTKTTVIRAPSGQKVSAKALLSIPQGIITKVTHNRGAASQVEFTKVAPVPKPAKKK